MASCYACVSLNSSTFQVISDSQMNPTHCAYAPFCHNALTANTSNTRAPAPALMEKKRRNQKK